MKKNYKQKIIGFLLSLGTYTKLRIEINKQMHYGKQINKNLFVGSEIKFKNI